MTDKKTENLCKEIQNSDLCRFKQVKIKMEGKASGNVEIKAPNMTHNTDIEEVVEDTRTKLNKAYLRLAYGKSDITKTKQEVNNILTTYRTTILKEVGEGLETVKITAIRRSEDDPRIQQAKMAQVLYDRDIKPALLKKLFSN